MRAEAEASEWLEMVGLSKFAEVYPRQLSGGMKQRVAIARSLANHPTVVLADEPTGNLDSRTGEEVIELLKELNAKDNVTIICSTHDPKMLASSRRVAWIEDGSLQQISTAEEFELAKKGTDGLGR